MSKVKAKGTIYNPPRNAVRPKKVLLVGTALIVGSLLVGCNNGKKDTDSPTKAVSSAAPTHKGGDPVFGDDAGKNTSDVNTKAVANYVDNRSGVQIFGTSAFGAATTPTDRAAFGTKLNVSCYVTNNTGQYTSVNALYKIVGGEWNGQWVPANVMLNSATAQVGDVNTPALDPRVKECN